MANLKAHSWQSLWIWGGSGLGLFKGPDKDVRCGPQIPQVSKALLELSPLFKNWQFSQKTYSAIANALMSRQAAGEGTVQCSRVVFCFNLERDDTFARRFKRGAREHLMVCVFPSTSGCGSAWLAGGLHVQQLHATYPVIDTAHFSGGGLLNLRGGSGAGGPKSSARLMFNPFDLCREGRILRIPQRRSERWTAL